MNYTSKQNNVYIYKYITFSLQKNKQYSRIMFPNLRITNVDNEQKVGTRVEGIKQISQRHNRGINYKGLSEKKNMKTFKTAFEHSISS